MASVQPKQIVIVPYFLPDLVAGRDNPRLDRDVAAVKRAIPGSFAPDVVIGPDNFMTERLREELGIKRVRTISTNTDTVPGPELEHALRSLADEKAAVAFVNVMLSPYYISQLGSKSNESMTERTIWSAVFAGDWRGFSLEECQPGDSTAYNKLRPIQTLFGAVDLRERGRDELARGIRSLAEVSSPIHSQSAGFAPA